MENQEPAQEQIDNAFISPDYKLTSKIFTSILATKNEKFKNSFQVAAPSIYADIESFYGNSNCSCRGKIEKYVSSNKQESVDFLNNFIAENGGENHTLFDINVIDNHYVSQSSVSKPTADSSSVDDKNPDDYSGTTELVKISEWKNYIVGLREKQVKFFQFSTVKVDDETVRVFFL